MTVVLVTGGRGFLAGHLVPALRRCGATRVVGTDVVAGKAPGFDALMATDLHVPAQARRVLEESGAEVVVHLAGRFRGTPEELERSNVGSTAALLEAIRERGQVRRLVTAGSAAEYGAPPTADGRLHEDLPLRPATPYGETKAKAGALALALDGDGCRVVVARLFNVVGAGMSRDLFVGALIHRILLAMGGPPPLRIAAGNLDVARDFVDVDDAAEALALLALSALPNGGACNVCSGVATPLQDIVDQLAGLAGVPVEFIRDPSLVRPGEPPLIVGAAGRLEAWCGFRPVRPVAESVHAAWDAALQASRSHA